MRRADKKGADVVDASGWAIRHCGHPTALWPYQLSAPAGHPVAGRVVVSFNGYGFRTKAAALLVVRDLVAGVATASTDRCAPNVARVINRDALGEAVRFVLLAST